MAPSKFKSQLEASSYHAPGGGELYRPLREKIVKQALEQGYDEPSMLEHAVTWADDQDPWGHIANAMYPHFTSACNFRLFESFEEQLKEKFQDFIKARGIGVIVKTTTLDIKRPVTYPDAVSAKGDRPRGCMELSNFRSSSQTAWTRSSLTGTMLPQQCGPSINRHP
jgi:hypothetical protein